MMRTLHRGLMLVLILGLLAGGVLVAQNSHKPPQMAEHDVQAHIDAVAEELNLTSRQRGVLADTIERTHALMQEFHQLHADLMVELDESQQNSLNAMMHQMMSGVIGGVMGEGAHGHACSGAECHQGADGAKHGHGALHGASSDRPSHDGASHEPLHEDPHGGLHKKGHGSIEL